MAGRKKFVVFEHEIYAYNPETDDRSIKLKQCIFCETLTEAKKVAKAALKKAYEYELKFIENGKYKDIR